MRGGISGVGHGTYLLLATRLSHAANYQSLCTILNDDRSFYDVKPCPYYCPLPPIDKFLTPLLKDRQVWTTIKSARDSCDTECVWKKVPGLAGGGEAVTLEHDSILSLHHDVILLRIMFMD